MCICNAYRSFTELQRDHSLFSLATPSAANDFLIYKSAADDGFHMWTRNNYRIFGGQNYKLNTWVSICSTWDAASGLMQLWIDGKPSSRIFVSSGSNINGPIIIVLGQVCCFHPSSASRAANYLSISTVLHENINTIVISVLQICTYHVQHVSSAQVLKSWKKIPWPSQTVAQSDLSAHCSLCKQQSQRFSYRGL